MRAFWGSHQRFFKQLCVSLKVDELVRVVRGALAAGQSVVIGLQSTGEAALDRAVSDERSDHLLLRYFIRIAAAAMAVGLRRLTQCAGL